MSAAVLRDADWRDIPAMARLERATFPEDAWTEASFWSELAQRPRRAYVVAVPEGTLVGVCGAGLVGAGEGGGRQVVCETSHQAIVGCMTQWTLPSEVMNVPVSTVTVRGPEAVSSSSTVSAPSVHETVPWY